MGADVALRDFLQRIEHYQERYEPLDEVTESELSFMKIFNTGEKVLVRKHEGHIQARIVYYLMNIHIIPRTIYLTRVSAPIHIILCIFYLNNYRFFLCNLKTVFLLNLYIFSTFLQVEIVEISLIYYKFDVNDYALFTAR